VKEYNIFVPLYFNDGSLIEAVKFSGSVRRYSSYQICRAEWLRKPESLAV